jgi:hypothetical protein
VVGIDTFRGLCVLFVVLLHTRIHFALRGYDSAFLLPKPIARVVLSSGYHAGDLLRLTRPVWSPSATR